MGPAANKRATATVAIVVTLALAWACGEDPTIAAIPVSLEITPSVDTVYVNEVATRLQARAFNARGDAIAGAPIIWRSDRDTVATVDSLTGAVTGVAPGVARVTARAGAAADTAEVVVLSVLRVFLPLDTILLAPGDTLTIPVEVLVAPGATPPGVTFAGGVPGVAEVDPVTGLVSALSPGSAAYVALADTVIALGDIEVLAITDTGANGLLYAGVSGAISVRRALASRAFNHPTDLGTLFQLVAQAAPLELDALLVDSLTGPETRTVETVPPGGLGIDPVCRPTRSFALLRRADTTALSLGGGTVSVTSDSLIQGGRAIGGRMDVELQRTDLTGDAGRVRVRATFVVPLLTLAECPRG